MMARNIPVILSLLLGASSIQHVFARNLPATGWDALPYNGLASSGFGAGYGLNGEGGHVFSPADTYTASFSDILYGQLIENSAFRNLFSVPISKDLAVNIGFAIAQSLATELGIEDSYLAANLLASALTSLYPEAGSEAYCRILANILGQIMLSRNMLNSASVLTLSNTLSRIIFNAVSPWYADIGLGTRLGVGVNTAAAIGVNANTGGVLTGISNFDFNEDLFMGGEVNTGASLDIGTIFDAGLGIGVDVDASADAGLKLGVKSGLNVAANTDTVAGAELDIAAGAKESLGIESEFKLVANGRIFCIGLGVGKELDFSVSEETAVLFRTELTTELLRNKYFSYVFSGDLSSFVLKQIGEAITQYLSKAFAVPRSFLLPLENGIGNLPLNVTPTPKLYAETIASVLAKIFISLNIVSNATARLGVNIAADAIEYGIRNFIEISTIPGIGLAINDDSYNSYFSLFNGLGKLSYVGIDSEPRISPPIVKTARSTKAAVRFAKILYYNLISSNTFSEVFLLSVRACACKQITISLGKFMAEAFGSLNPIFFSEIYLNDLLAVKNKLNCKTYAGALSLATTKALYLLGYFTSGNVNIQAAIASKAIMRALKVILNPGTFQVALFPEYAGLPWITQLRAAVPPESLLKLGIGVGIASGIGLDLGLGLGLKANLAIDAEVESDAEIDTHAAKRRKRSVDEDDFDMFDFDDELDFDDEFSFLFDEDFDLNAYLALKVSEKAAVGAGVEAKAGLDAEANLEVGAIINADLDAEVGLNVDDDLDINVQLSILDILPRILANKLYLSTALYTSIKLVGARKVINLIAQSIAAEFGLPIASIFLHSYYKYFVNNADNFRISVIALAVATTEALTDAGLLNSVFTVLTVDQLASSIVAQYSSLIATSLDTKSWTVGPQWSYGFGQAVGYTFK